MESLASNGSNYRVISNGQLRDGFDANGVQTAFAALFKISLEQARAIVGTKKVIKKGLPLDKAKAYQQKLEKIGLVINVEGTEAPKELSLSLEPLTDEPKQTVSPVKDKAPSLEQTTSPLDGLALEPIAGKQPDQPQPDAKPDPLNESKAFTCPKCQLKQEPSEECVGCGIFFSKYKAPVEPDNTTGASSDSTSQVTQTNNEDAEEEPEIIFSEDNINVKALGAAAVAAVLGALVWMVIAMISGYELSLVAIGIGAAVGFVASLFGAKGQNAGIACAALTFVAILGGKYLAIDVVVSQLEDLMSSEFMEEGMKATYDYMVYEAEAYETEVTDDNSLREFIVNNDYSESYEVSEVTAEEIDYLKTEVVPEFEYISENNPTYEEWYSYTMEGVDEETGAISSWSLMIDSLEALDFLFLIFGVGSAYQLGSRGREKTA